MTRSPHFQKLLDDCQDMQFSHLRPLLDRMFENADIALLDFAEKAESNMTQSVFFDAMNELRKKRKLVEETFFSEIRHSYQNFPAAPDDRKKLPDTENIAGHLSLIETDEMETTVATLNATGKLTHRIMDRIFALKQRLTIINGGHAISKKQIPGGPSWLGAAFQRSVEQLDLQNKTRLVFIAVFDKYVLSQAVAMFDEYNKQFVTAEILPNLRYEIRKQPDGNRPGQKTGHGTQKHESPDDALLDHSQTPSELGDELFRRICSLMTGRDTDASNPSGRNPAQAGPTPGSRARSSSAVPALLSQLSAAQSAARSKTANRSSSDYIENIEIDQNFIDRLQITLVDERERIFGGIDRLQLPEADNNLIELVGMLFEYMLREDTLPNVVKALLSRLHTPLLKVAVLDRQFFTRTRHPARKLLNDMTSAGIRWVNESQPDQLVLPKMKEIVDSILRDFDHDVTLFEKFSDEFSSYIDELRQRAELVEKRAAEAANGQDKLLSARSRAQHEIDRLQQGKPAVAAVHDFLHRLWADKLTFILLRDPKGTESDNWRQTTALAQAIVESGMPAADAKQRDKRSQELNSLQEQLREATETLQHADREKLLIALFTRQQQVLKELAPEHSAPYDTPASEPAPPIQAAAPVARLTNEQIEMIEKLKAVPFGTWFEFSAEGNHKQRAKLSWRSTVTKKFMFVDQMGVKAAVIAMQELADKMLNGSVHIIAVDKKPFVDRALAAIHKMLDRSIRSTASA
ncbi:MAG: DUF1631 family protein [Thiogranum sp.]|nr:DUF1631 family protein [Thiogranum sp.]